MTDLETLLNNDLARLCTWIQTNNLNINAVETKFMIIASATSLWKLMERQNIQILGKTIKQAESIDCLGMMLNQKLKWSKHVRSVSTVKLAHYLPSNALFNGNCYKTELPETT